MMTETRTSTQSRLCINLGNKVADRLQTAAKIKNAMALAIMLLVENDLINQDNPDFGVYQEIYLEANYLESLLKDL
jgi:hypothetical protein